MEAYDFYVGLYKKSLVNLEKEKLILSSLSKESIKAALPAVGEQPHWNEAGENIQALVEVQKKKVSSEYRRFWKNRELVLKEAIRKMRFVKVETMSQLNELMAERKTAPNSEGDTISRVSSAVAKNNEVIFPFDGVV